MLAWRKAWKSYLLASTVDVRLDADDLAATVRGEEGYRLCDLVGLADPVKRHRLGDFHPAQTRGGRVRRSMRQPMKT